MLLIAGARSSRLVYNGTRYSGSAGSSYTFNNVAISDAEPDRAIIIGAAMRHTTNPTENIRQGISSVTVDNATSTGMMCRNYFWGDLGDTSVELYSARISSGTTTNISINTNASMNFLEIAVFSIYGMRDPTPPSNIYGTLTYDGTSGGSAILYEGGAIIYIAHPGYSVSGFPNTISGTQIRGGYVFGDNYNANYTFSVTSGFVNSDVIRYGGVRVTP